MGNLPAYRVYRPETFTTNASGFRKNPTEDTTRPPDILMTGDSFAAGCGVNDDETLTVQLEGLTHRRIYNAGYMKIDLMRILRRIDQLHMVSGIVILQYLERYSVVPIQDLGYTSKETLNRWDRLHKIVDKSWEGFWQVSPVQILSQRLYRRLLNDRILPNTNAAKVVLGTLKNGRPILFFSLEAERFKQPPENIDLSGILKLQWELRQRHIDLLMVLTPDKYSVYAGLLAQPPVHVPNPPYLDRLSKMLEQAHVPAVNLLSVLQNQAASDLNQGVYIYWLDDTHWNARGIRVAAEEIRKHL